METKRILKPFNGNDQIQRTLWNEEKRMEFYPTFLPKHGMVFESMVFRYMEEYCKPYKGGYWNFYTLSNKGFYIGLRRDSTLQVENHLNYFSQEMSVDAASIGVNLLALCDCASKGDRSIINAFQHLREYAKIHPEGHLILRFID